jgi:hypothetical protein
MDVDISSGSATSLKSTDVQPLPSSRMIGNREPSRSVYLDYLERHWLSISTERLEMLNRCDSELKCLGKNITALQDAYKSSCECGDHYSSRFALLQLKICSIVRDKIWRDNHWPITGMVHSAWTARTLEYIHGCLQVLHELSRAPMGCCPRNVCRPTHQDSTSAQCVYEFDCEVGFAAVF